MHTNRLIDEKSPYLQQHAHNPVNWLPWGEEAFEKARRENKPIFLSVGYSTCHWCHVMERESFENEAVAEVMNREFVPIKVDREERPDVDRIYMMFVQATTGGGGWPMSVWLTPELKPFFGGTYFPPDNRYGRPGFRDILERIADAWRLQRAEIEQSTVEILTQLRQFSEVTPGRNEWLDPQMLDSAYQVLRRSFDSRLGGFGGAPKFPRPVVHNFLLRYWRRTGNEEARDMVLDTLRAMARGGMNDQLGGGFHRYSVDARWFVPHFEKMLYDQAQLAVSYLEAYRITGDEFHARIARDILEYVARDMTSPEGGFYSAEDADSIIDAANPVVKGEGAYYIWTAQEIERVLGAPAAEMFAFRYGIEPTGNVLEDPHHEFTGKNILHEAHTIEQTASRFGVSEDQARASLDESRRKLLEARAARPRPHLDDKILTAWNGLMISAFAQAGRTLGESAYTAAGRRAADFVLAKLRRPDGRLLRRYREGEPGVDAFLDDYAFLIQALLDLYEGAFDARLLKIAVELTDTMRERFEDRASGGFFSTAEGDGNLLLRMKDDYDGAEPSGNSIAALDLLRLAHITGREDYRESAERGLRAFGPRMASGASAVPQMLVAYLTSMEPGRQIVLAGTAETAEPFLRVIARRFLPFTQTLLADTAESRTILEAWQPQIAQMQAHAEAAAYVCENFTCGLPLTDASALEKALG